MTILMLCVILTVGLLMYLLLNNPPSASPIAGKVGEIGKIMFFCALLALCLSAESVVRALTR